MLAVFFGTTMRKQLEHSLNLGANFLKACKEGDVETVKRLVDVVDPFDINKGFLSLCSSSYNSDLFGLLRNHKYCLPSWDKGTCVFVVKPL